MKFLKIIFILSLIVFIAITIVGAIKVFDGTLLASGKWIYRATLIDVAIFLISAIGISVFNEEESVE